MSVSQVGSSLDDKFARCVTVMTGVASGNGHPLEVVPPRDGEEDDFFFGDANPKVRRPPPTPCIHARVAAQLQPGLGIADHGFQDFAFALIQRLSSTISLDFCCCVWLPTCSLSAGTSGLPLFSQVV